MKIERAVLCLVASPLLGLFNGSTARGQDFGSLPSIGGSPGGAPGGSFGDT